MRRESHVCATYPDGRYVVATTCHAGFAVALVKAVLAMKVAR